MFMLDIGRLCIAESILIYEKAFIFVAVLKPEFKSKYQALDWFIPLLTESENSIFARLRGTVSQLRRAGPPGTKGTIRMAG
jgi:hypothetical protein